jgi:hypothetical protein
MRQLHSAGVENQEAIEKFSALALNGLSVSHHISGYESGTSALHTRNHLLLRILETALRLHGIYDSIDCCLRHLQGHPNLLLLSYSDSSAIGASLRYAWAFIDYFDALCRSVFNQGAVGVELVLRVAATTGLVVRDERTLLIGSEKILTSVIEEGGVLYPAKVVLHQRGIEFAASVSSGKVVLVGADSNERTPALRSQLARWRLLCAMNFWW